MGRTITKWVILAVTVALCVYDLVIFLATGVHSTISRVLHSWSDAYIILPLAIGFLLGHLLWPQRLPPRSEAK